MSHLSPLAVPTLLTPAGHATAQESTLKPERCHGGDRSFCSSFRSCHELKSPARVSPGRVGVALLSQAVTAYCFFPRGWSSRLWRITDISRYHPQLSTLAHTRGTSPCLPGSRGHTEPTEHGDTATARRGAQGAGLSPRGGGGVSAGACGAEHDGCPVGAEGFALLSGGVAGQLGFGGECPSPSRACLGSGGGTHPLAPRDEQGGGPAHPAVSPLQGSPPRPTEEPSVPWALEVSPDTG